MDSLLPWAERACVLCTPDRAIMPVQRSCPEPGIACCRPAHLTDDVSCCTWHVTQRGRLHVVQVQTAPRSVHMGRRRSRLATTTLARPATPSASCSASRRAPARALVSALPAARAPPPAAAAAAAPTRSAAAAGLPTSAVCAAATRALNVPEGGRSGLLVDRIAMYVGWPWLPVPRRIVTAVSTAARLSSASA